MKPRPYRIRKCKCGCGIWARAYVPRGWPNVERLDFYRTWAEAIGVEWA